MPLYPPAAAGGVTDGDKGDITISGAGSVYTVDNDVVTYAKMQNVSGPDKVLGRVTVGAGDPEEIATTGSGNVVRATSPALTTPDIGAAVGTSLETTAQIKSSSPSAGNGYKTGAGGTVTQITSKATGVTLNTICGQVVTHNAALASNAKVSFVVTNSSIDTTDVVGLNIDSGGTLAAYIAWISAVGAGSFTVTILNNTAGSLSEAITLNFAIIKAVTS
jgi:hypothetical protein